MSNDDAGDALGDDEADDDAEVERSHSSVGAVSMSSDAGDDGHDTERDTIHTRSASLSSDDDDDDMQVTAGGSSSSGMAAAECASYTTAPTRRPPCTARRSGRPLCHCGCGCCSHATALVNDMGLAQRLLLLLLLGSAGEPRMLSSDGHDDERAHVVSTPSSAVSIARPHGSMPAAPHDCCDSCACAGDGCDGSAGFASSSAAMAELSERGAGDELRRASWSAQSRGAGRAAAGAGVITQPENHRNREADDDDDHEAEEGDVHTDNEENDAITRGWMAREEGSGSALARRAANDDAADGCRRG